jgi:small GTP-binding protein
LGSYYEEGIQALSSCKQQYIQRYFSTYPDFQGQYRLLTEEESALLAEQRALTEKARALASHVETVQVRAFTDNFLGNILPDDQSTFSIVIAGEFNSGKSTLINALLGTKLLETGALPTTDSITILTYGSSNATQTNAGGHGGVILHQVSGVPLLQDLTLIDTPGTNAVVLNHTARTLKLLPSADLILFVTSADRPFPDSERAILKSIQSYRKNIVMVVNKMDVLETSGGNHGEEEKRRVVDFVTDHASELLGARPYVIPISARDALSAKTVKDQESGVWKRSNFAALEFFLKETLTTQTRIKSKLTNPIGVTEGIMADCLRALADEKRELEIDIATLNLLRSQFGGWEKEMNADMESFRREIGSILSHEGSRWQRLQKRMSLFDMYMCAFDEDRLYLEWKRTKRLGPDAVQGIEEELLSFVRDTA